MDHDYWSYTDHKTIRVEDTYEEFRYPCGFIKLKERYRVKAISRQKEV